MAITVMVVSHVIRDAMGAGWACFQSAIGCALELQLAPITYASQVSISLDAYIAKQFAIQAAEENLTCFNIHAVCSNWVE